MASENIVERPAGFRSRRFVFDTLHASREMTNVANAAGWLEKVRREGDGVSTPTLVIKWEVRPGMIATYEEKEGIDTSFVMVASSLGGDEVASAVSVFAAHPHVLTFDDLLSGCAVAENPAEEGSALTRLGLGAPALPDPRFVTVLTQGAAAESDSVREGALWGMGYAEWPEFRAALAEASRTDPDEFLRKVASTVLKAFDRIGVGEPLSS